MRLCTHPEHAQYGMGHLPGPRPAVEYSAAPVELPQEYISQVAVPILNQGSTPECEAYTAVNGRRITQSPIGQDGFDPDDLFKLGGGGPDGATTAGMEKALLSPGALCTTGPDHGARKPVTCQNIGSLTSLQTAVMAEQFAGLSTAWYESWFSPLSDGTLPKPDTIAGYHEISIRGWRWRNEVQLYVQNSWGFWGPIDGYCWLPVRYLPDIEAYTQVTEANMVSRLTGADRFAVAAAVSKSRYPSAATVYVANGAAYSDIACAATAAAAEGVPLLLVEANDIPAATATELTRLAPHEIIVVGGPGSVSAATMAALGGYTK
jgi:hypothetical protein